MTVRDLPAPAVGVEVASDGFTGYSRLAFELEGEALRSMMSTA